MQVVICYDVDDNKVRRKLVKYLESFAVRIQYSVFVSDLNDRAIKRANTYARELLKECANARFVIFKTHDNSVADSKMPPGFVYL